MVGFISRTSTVYASISVDTKLTDGDKKEKKHKKENPFHALSGIDLQNIQVRKAINC